MSSIKQWLQDERPREKMAARGAEALTDSELLAIILRTGDKDASAVDLARRLMEMSGNSLGVLSGASLDKLKSVKGVGEVKAITVKAVFELGRRLALRGVDSNTQVLSSRTVVDLLRPVLKDLDHEECWVLYLNRGNRLIGREKMSTGGHSATVMDVKMIARNAVEKLASGLILVHNHPSGNASPGKQDIAMTESLRDAIRLFDMNLLDHIIIAGNSYFSVADENLSELD